MPTETLDTLRGTVLALHDGKATVRLHVAPVSGGCNACAHGSSCGIGRLAALGRSDENFKRGIQLNLDAPAGIQAGDEVHLLAPPVSLARLALLGYLFPAIALLLGAALGQSFYGSDGITALFAMFAFLLALVVVRLATARRSSLCSLSLSHPEFSHEH
ncbi:hypothetical protein AGMMS50225_10440 [Betaproteobacteria bacterium]|nr:hypothetical protein AGMMS50225_10440 [Betaproteobacteria bacterium]